MNVFQVFQHFFAVSQQIVFGALLQMYFVICFRIHFKVFFRTLQSYISTWTCC